MTNLFHFLEPKSKENIYKIQAEWVIIPLAVANCWQLNRIAFNGGVLQSGEIKASLATKASKHITNNTLHAKTINQRQFLAQLDNKHAK